MSKSFASSSSSMNRVPSKNPKGYKRFGLFVNDLDPVPYDSVLDPRPKTCFNCWAVGHRLINCPKPVTDIFCCNCGRRYVKIDRCPRCARQFWELDEGARQWLASYIPDENQKELTDCSEKNRSRCADDATKGRFCKETQSGKLKVIKADFEREDLSKCESNSTSILKTHNRDGNRDDNWSDCSRSDIDNVEEKLNPTIMGKKVKEVEFQKSSLANEVKRHKKENLRAADEEADCIAESHLNSIRETSMTTELDENDEDLDNVIVDEDKQTDESCVVGDTVRNFLDLLKAAKYLPLQTQHIIILRFASKCKKEQ